MASKELPFTDQQVQDWVADHETPFFMYDEDGIQQTAEDLNTAFDWVQEVDGTGYVNHFAVKALPNPYVLDILHDAGMGADASSGAEIDIARAANMEHPLIMFTSNNKPAGEYAEAADAGAILNLDGVNEINIVREALGRFPTEICFRYTPGNQRTTGVNEIIGRPEDSKFGIPDEELELAYKRAKNLGAERFGIHTMVVSNELDAKQHVATAQMLFKKVAELSEKVGIEFDFANLGGGLGIPYRPDEEPLDYTELRNGIIDAYDEHIAGAGLPQMRVITENGRHVTGPNGYLVTSVRSVKKMFDHRLVSLDATTSSAFPRAVAYDAFHFATVIGKRIASKRAGEVVVQRVVGSLCENNDYFTGAETKDRLMPLMEPNDIVVWHDAGAHTHAMANNYNGNARPPEYILRPDGQLDLIRKAETRDNMFTTLDHPNLVARG